MKGLKVKSTLSRIDGSIS